MSRVEYHVITAQRELVRVHRTDAADIEPVAFICAPGSITMLDCVGDKIAAGCKSGEVLQLLAAAGDIAGWSAGSCSSSCPILYKFSTKFLQNLVCARFNLRVDFGATSIPSFYT